jgi:hypothetical protein
MALRKIGVSIGSRRVVIGGDGPVDEQLKALAYRDLEHKLDAEDEFAELKARLVRVEAALAEGLRRG